MNPQKWGMRLDSLTPAVVRDIVSIYIRIAHGADYWREYSDEEIALFAAVIPDDVARYGISEIRLHSRLGPSKLLVIPDHRGGELIRFIFNPNLDDHEIERDPEAVQATETGFEEEVARYLQDTGLGVPIDE